MYSIFKGVRYPPHGGNLVEPIAAWRERECGLGHIEKSLQTPVAYAQMADGDLLCLVAEEDRSAFAELFRRFAGRIKAFLLRWGMPGDQAEEVAQEVMVAIWRRADSFDPAKAAASTWIFAIARNRRIDLIRKTARREPDPEDPLFERDPDPDGMVLLSLQERQRIIREAIQELPQDQQDVLRIAFFEGLSHGECAEALDVPLGTVKSRIRLAFRKLREALGEDFVEELLND